MFFCDCIAWFGLYIYVGHQIVFYVTSLLTLIWSVQCQCFSVAGWQSITEKQKQIVTLSLYHAANWIRELVSAIAGIFIVMVDSNIHYGLQCFSTACSLMPSARKLLEDWNV